MGAPFNFPNSPSFGALYSPGAGLPTYMWEGEKWTTLGSSPSKIPVYTDGSTPMTAQLTLITPPVAPTDAVSKAYADLSVRADATQSYTAAQQQVARQNIYAAPFDAMAYSGLQINGGMDISQERGTTATTTSASWICDGWQLFSTSSAVVSASAIGTAGFLPGISNHIQATVTTASASLTGTQFNAIIQNMEGLRCARLAWGTANAQPITLGFWTGHHRAGTYSISIRNSADNRSYTATYTQNVGDIWEYKSVTIPGDTTGTWLADNTIGMRVNFVQACGPTYTAPATNTWYGATYVAAPGQVNGVAATTDAFRITGVIILPGTQAPTAQQSPFVMRPYDQELLTCLRYYRRTTGEVGSEISIYAYAATSGANFGQAILFPVPMRAAPTIGSTGTWAAGNCTGPSFAGVNTTSYSPYVTSTTTANISFQPNGSARLSFDARL